MTHSFSIKAVAAAALALAAAGAQAGPFFLDIGSNYGGVVAGKVNPTSTSVKDQFTYQYVSQTVITDTNGDLNLSVGDKAITNAGFGALAGANGSLGLNNITGFTPNQTSFPPAESNNGYGTSWQMSFSVQNLTSTVSAITTGPELVYDAGAVVKFYVWDTNSGASALNFMNVVITGGASGTGGTILNGRVDFTGIAANPFANLFNAANYNCAGATGFYDIWQNCGAGAGDALDISFRGDFNTDLTIPPVVIPGNPLQFRIGPARHDGSATFSVPEPASLALLGLALTGAGFVGRRRVR